jgi:hypothetical protein
METNKTKKKGRRNNVITKAQVYFTIPTNTLSEATILANENDLVLPRMISDFLEFFVKEYKGKKVVDIDEIIKSYKLVLLKNKNKQPHNPDSTAIWGTKTRVNLTLDSDLAEALRENPIFRKYNISALINDLLWKVYNEELKKEQSL